MNKTTTNTFLFPFLNYCLRPAINNPEFADVILRFRQKRTTASVSNEQQQEQDSLFYAHQAILTSRSYYFRKVLGSIQQTDANTIPECLIEEEVTPQFFAELLKYIYTGEHIPSMFERNTQSLITFFGIQGYTQIRLWGTESEMSLSFQRLVNNPKYSDCILKVDKSQFYAHKVFLCRLAFFRSLFSGNWKENNPVDAQNRTIVDLTHNVSSLAITIWLQFLYGDKLSIPNLDVALECLSLATFYVMEDMQFHVEAYIAAQINDHTVCVIWNVAAQYQSAAICRLCREFFVANVDKIIDNSSVIDLEYPQLVEGLKYAYIPFIKLESTSKMLSHWADVHKDKEGKLMEAAVPKTTILYDYMQRAKKESPALDLYSAISLTPNSVA